MRERSNEVILTVMWKLLQINIFDYIQRIQIIRISLLSFQLFNTRI